MAPLVVSPSGSFPDGKALQSGLAVFAFRRKELSSAQTKTSLRLSRPNAGKAVCLLSGRKETENIDIKKPDFHLVF